MPTIGGVTLTIAGFALDEGRWDGLYVGRRKGNDLVYAGKVDHGFDKTSAAELRRRLTPLIRKTQPYSKNIAHKALWVEPKLLAEVEYRAKSAEGKVRHPGVQGVAGRPLNEEVRAMCNLYSITTNQAAIVALFRAVNQSVGNLPPMPGVFPDYPAPVIRNFGAERELTMMRWGMPPPPKFGGAPVTNIRNTSSPHWRGWLKPKNRCLVPFNSFAEYAPEPNPETKKKDVVWFALNEDRPLTAFAGIWTQFKGDRGTKSKPVPGPHLVYGFLTTAPNAVVEPIHPKAMPVKGPK
jgi:putative SOS response-associated peptidase YedK